MTWSVVGFLLSLSVTAVAWRSSRAPGGFYTAEVYGMEPGTHRRYALLSLVFAAYFALAFRSHWEAAGIAGLALYALIAVFYATSFLRGASDD